MAHIPMQYTGNSFHPNLRRRNSLATGYTTLAYDFSVEYTDGSVLTLQRRERPQVYIEGDDAYLITTAKINGPDRAPGGTTCNLIQKFR